MASIRASLWKQYGAAPQKRILSVIQLFRLFDDSDKMPVSRQRNRLKAALPAAPSIYRRRQTFSPLIRVQ